MIFRNFVLENFPFLEDDFDGLTDYQLFCKMVEYMKKSLEKITLYQEELNAFDLKLQELQAEIDNFNVQEEVDNKLDEMYEDGTLENLISQYIELATTYVYNNVAEMKEATNLVNGSFARTSGFYSNDDGGGALYKVRTITSDDTIDEITLIALSDINLVAELLIQTEMSVKCFGAKGDGETDDTTFIQKAFDNCKNIVINNGTYMVDAEVSLYPVSNSNITLINATLKAITNEVGTYRILWLRDVDNVNITGGVIEGDRTTHTGEDGEWGFGIHISGWSENISISNMIIKDCWGDGIYINRGKNINTQNVVCDNNRRQGISIISVDGYHSLNDRLINTNGYSPESGIDIEPNAATDKIKNIILENLYTENNEGDGIDIWLPNLDNTTDYTVSIKIINHHDVGSKTGERIGGIHSNIRHNIVTENPILENNDGGIMMRDCFDNGKDKVMIINPKIINCNYYNPTTSTYVCGISGYTTNDETTEQIGGVTIINPFVSSAVTDTNRRGISFYDTTNTNRANNIDIINPINKQDNLNIAVYGDNLIFTDEFNKYKWSGNSAKTLGASELLSRLTNINFTSARTLTIGTGVPIGYKITFVNEKISYRYKIQFDSTDYCRYFNSSAGNLVSSDGMNSLITIQKIANHEWIVENIVGNFTATPPQ